MTGPETKPRILSGVQPSGEAHLGNYLGAFRQWVRMQDAYEGFYCIVDLHAIMQPYESAELPHRVFEMAVSLLAVGIDPNRSTLFVQSDVPEHTELAWLFNALTPVGDLERMTQYKDKSARLESIPAGILTYPILQTADILIYKASVVPVGDDQRQHLELARDVARRFNARYGDTFPEPEAVIPEVGRIIGLDGKAKMSKSIGNTVGLLDDPEQIWSKVRTAVTDPQRVRKADPGRPELCNVFALHKLVTDPAQLEDIAAQCRAATRGCVDCKRILADAISAEFAPFREAGEYFRAHPEEVREILDAGADRARTVARATMVEVRDRMGLDWRKALP